jgi:siroheme synthase
MTGDGRDPAARTPAPTVTVLGAGGGDPETAEGADLLAAADAVLTTPDVESTVLFYAEAWRVERLPDLAGAAAAVADLIGLGAVRVVLAVPGDPATNPGCRALLDGLRVAGIEAAARPGVSLVPPRLSPMPW